MDIIRYVNPSEEKPVQYLGLLVPKLPHLLGSFSLRALLSSAETDLSEFMWSTDKAALLNALMTNGLEKSENYEIHIIHSSKNMQELFNVQENEIPEKKALITYLNKMLETHRPEYAGTVHPYSPQLFNQNLDIKQKIASQTVDTKKTLGK